MRSNGIRRETGITLIEVLVCMFILAIGMIAGLGMTQAGQAGLDAGRRISMAAGLAQSKMEEEVAANYSDLIQGGLEGTENLDGFIRSWKIRPNTPAEHCLTIRVVTEWPDRAGRLRRLELVALRSEGVVP
jgi:Tfp pilus assembly protein PilV